ncbi:MAG: glycoside hydrolase family 3 protein [Firmicutes bacterium]|nr:glycoside hydrolase family 3 protein [Bacillota bacterium]
MQTQIENLPDIKELSIEEKVGQMFLIDFSGFEVAEGSRVDNHLKSVPWGGVILFAKNVESREKLLGLNSYLETLNRKIPLFISVDQEGGIVNRAVFEGMNIPPGNMAVGATGDAESAFKAALVSGMDLRELGFNFNYAPVADVNSNPANPIIGVRSFGENPALVAEMTAAAVRGYQKAGIIACAKHFPGHGDTSTDSHLDLPRVDGSMERLDSTELPPFRASIEAEVGSVMTAHVLFPAIDGDSPEPATLSRKVLTGLLREKMGYNGVIITDSMAMKAIADNYGPEDASIRTILAGADIVMLLGPFENQIKAYNAVVGAVKDGKIPMEYIDKSVERILELKRKYICNPPAEPQLSPERRREIIRDITARSITVLKGGELLPLNAAGKNILVLSPDRLLKTDLDENDVSSTVFPEISKSAEKAKRVVYSWENPVEAVKTALKQEKWDIVAAEIFARALLTPELEKQWKDIVTMIQSTGSIAVVIPLLSPYSMPDNADISITGYNFSRLSMEMAASKLLGI